MDKKKTIYLYYFLMNAALSVFSVWETQSQGTLFLLFLLLTLSVPRLSPLKRHVLFFCPSNPSASERPYVPRWQETRKTAGVDTFRLRVTRCCLNAHLSETSPSRSEGGKKKQGKKKKTEEKLPRRKEKKMSFNKSITKSG